MTKYRYTPTTTARVPSKGWELPPRNSGQLQETWVHSACEVIGGRLLPKWRKTIDHGQGGLTRYSRLVIAEEQYRALVADGSTPSAALAYVRSWAGADWAPETTG